MSRKETNRNDALKDAIFAEGDVDDDFLERFAEETGWKSVLLYQYLSGYIVMVAGSALTATAISWLEMMFVIITPYISEEEQAETNYFVSIIILMDIIYLIDIIFRVLYSMTNWPNMKLFNEPVPIEYIIIDIISVIPYDLMYKAVQNAPLVIAVLRLRVMLRLYRIATSLSQLNKMFHEVSNFATIIWSAALMLLCIIFASSIHYIIYCDYERCKYRDYGNFIKVYGIAARYLMANGADFVAFEVTHIYHMYSILAIIYLLGRMLIVADLACKNINRMKGMYSFIHDYQKTMNLYNFMKDYYRQKWNFEDEQIYFTLKDYYFHYFRQRNGISAERVLHKILPDSLTKTIIMDMAFDSFRHSHIFRNLDLNIVRFLSTLVQFEFAVPGQVIARKGDYFNKMIYISHGVLQVLSHEDGETPVLNLSGGTSLGETTLFLSYPLNCTIICQTYCELVVIQKSQIIKMIAYYPDEYRELVKSIIERFDDAKRLRSVVHERMDPNLLKSDLLILSWIKQFQQCFLHDIEKQNDSRLESKIRGLEYYINNLILYVAYLDKLVVSEEIELVKDSVFLKSTYHFILQPHSPILLVWNVAVLLMTIFFILIYPYNLCYPSEKKSIQTAFAVFVTCLFWLDIYLQIVTAVKTRGATYLTIKSILVYRLRQKEFLIDCFAAFPLEYLMILLTGKMPDIVFMFLQANRLAKYYKIVCFFDDINVWSTNTLTVFNYIKFIMHFLFFYYYATMLIYIFNCYEDVCTPEFAAMLTQLDAKSVYRKILAVIPLANALITGIIIDTMPKTDNAWIHLGYITIAGFGYLLKAQFFVNVISSSALQNRILLKQQELLLGIVEALEWFDVSKSYRYGIVGYLNTLFYFNADVYQHYNNMVLPPELGASLRNIHLSRILGKNTFFKISKNLNSFLSASLKIVIIPANMVVFYCGQAIDKCYIIQQGYCTMWNGNVSRDVTINENLGLVEVLLDVPIFHTIVTRTDCIFLQISKTELQKFFSNFVQEGEAVHTALREFAKCEPLLSRNTEINLELSKFFQNNESSGKIYGNTSYGNRIKRIKFAFSSLKSYKFHFKIISTTSRCLLIWEFVKNIALVISLGYAAIFAAILSDTINFYFFLFLDSFCFVDMLLRFSVTYFDKNGFEIQKFSKTSVHYLTHAFLIDFLGSFPIDLWIPQGALIFTRLNRFLLTYRIIGLARYLTQRIKKVRQYVFAAHLLIFLMLTQNLASYYVTYLCTRTRHHVLCTADSWFVLSIKHIQARQILFESLLYLLSIFVGVGFRRYKNIGLIQRFMLSIWGILGHLTVIIIVGCAVSYNLFRNADLTMYQEAMSDLVRFLSYCDIDKNIKYEVIQHFEYIWEKRQGKNIADMIQQFPTSIKKDLLFDIYGKYLCKNGSVFNFAEKNFLKSLLMIIKQETFRKTGVIYRIDDIHGTIFFLMKGSVEVVGPDTNRLMTLASGSLFGCLDDCVESRQTLTMVAKGHVETLSFSSVAFYKLLNQHPRLRIKFLQIANMHFDFIPSNSESNLVDQTPTYENVRRSFLLNNVIIHKMSKLRTKIRKPSKHFQRLELGLFIMEFVFGSAYELFLMVINPTLIFVLIAYMRDSLWVIRMYMKFHIAYEDEFGMLEFNRKKVVKRYFMQRDGFYFDLFCILPLDIFMVLVSNDNMRGNLTFLLRINRFFRCIHLFKYMSRTTKKLNINVLLMGTAYLIMFAYIYVIIKFIIYFWSETFLIKDPEKTNWELILHSMNYLDTILFMFCTSSIPYTDFFSGWAPTTLCIIICCDTCFLVFFFSNLVGTLQVVIKVKSKYISICHNLKLLMLICDASSPLIDKVTMYTNILLRIRNGIQFPFLLEQAPYYLREAVLNSMFGFHLRNHYLFKDCHIDFLRQLSATMRTLTYFEGNKICDAGDIDETMYFIQEGVVQALTKDTLYSEVCEHLLVAGESFGLNQILYPRCGQYYTYKASVLTTLVTINRNEFTRLLTFYPSVNKHIYNRSIEFAS